MCGGGGVELDELIGGVVLEEDDEPELRLDAELRLDWLLWLDPEL